MNTPCLPIIPSDLLMQYQVEDVGDTRFRACARLLQSMWREDQRLPVGSYKQTSTTAALVVGLTGLRACPGVTF